MVELLPISVLKSFSKSILLGLFWLFASGCSGTDGLSESFKFDSDTAQGRLIDELLRKNIEIKVDSNGQVWFSAQDSDQVHAIAEDIMVASPGSTVTLHYADEKYTNLLVQKLRDNNVPFEMSVVNSHTELSLYQKDANLWGKYKEQVDQLYKEAIKEKTKTLGGE
jgi:hypothetical protein